MKYLLKMLFLVYVIYEIVNKRNVTIVEILLLLFIIAVNVFKERFFDSIYMVLIGLILVAVGSAVNTDFIIILPIVVFDFVYKEAYLLVSFVLACDIYFLWGSDKFALITLISGICGLVAYMLRKSDEKENRFKNLLDDERRLRYELEKTRDKLLNSSKEVAYLAEVKERNRIARDIHDNIGHSITGILIQLQAAYKLYDMDDERSKDILKKSIDGLSDSVSMLRDTVHNIKPRDNLGVEYINSIIKDFGFCPVEFKFTGDFSTLPLTHYEALISNLKEALTNSAKHSKASKVEISIDMNERFTRLFFKDNGVGCSRIKEGLGLSGMRERMANMGGSISISSDNGFVIVCLIPVGENLWK